MLAINTAATKLSPEALAYVLGWSPDHDARMWMKAQTPLWLPNVPLDVLADFFQVTPIQRQTFAARILGDSVKRFGYATPADYMKSPPSHPDWSFNWPNLDGIPSQQYRLAPQETTLAHVVWAIENGYAEEGFNVLALQFLAYQLHGWWDPAEKKNPAKWYLPQFEMTQSEWSELRNGGNPKQNYGTAGRHRHARGCIDYAANALSACAFFGQYDGPQVEYLQLKLSWHVGNVAAKFPLIDDPRGDHFGLATPFVSAYQTAALRHAVELALHVTNNGVTRIECVNLLDRIDTLLKDFGPVNTADPSAPASSWWYDIPFKDGKPRLVVPGEQGAQINAGIAGVAAYHVPMLLTSTVFSGSGYYEAMRDDAKAKNWPKIHPAETCWAFGTLAL